MAEVGVQDMVWVRKYVRVGDDVWVRVCVRAWVRVWPGRTLGYGLW